ncbi:hypothetical protein LEP1GSC035_0650 [Leptospira noguchii str. 2007001578]|uniref:Lipoprotein n=1 Tax=Leptospira noguchii str. 2007001578 TaxID=1049974 RepID=A0ABP2T5Q2_9LEPT|nr:hypothetical protein LEP1GSC035_0650 [Leptospira noguchii str. 2007001578]
MNLKSLLRYACQNIGSTQCYGQWNSISICKNMPFNPQFGAVRRVFPS